MIRFPLGFLATAAVAGLASPASADDVSLGFGVSGHHGHVGFGVGVTVPVRPAPPPPVYGYPAPAPYPGGYGVVDDCDACRRVFVPAHEVTRPETVCVPAVYEDRCVPVYREVCVPVYEERRIPVYEDRCVPVVGAAQGMVIGRIVDPRHGFYGSIGVRTGPSVVYERHERVLVGTRVERVQVGTRRETVQVGTRTERVLVTPETTRVVARTEWVPGRYVTVCDAAEHHHAGLVVTGTAYRREMAAIGATASFRR